MKIHISLIIQLSVLVIASLATIACKSGLSSYPSLINQGIMPLSPSNAYLGSNLFLGEEAEKSRILYQFLKGRGAPGAIEIVEQDLKPSRLLLYYPRQIQVYFAELDNRGNEYDWIIRGPYSIERNDFRKLLDVERANYEASPIIVKGKIERFVPEIATPVATVLIPALPSPEPTLIVAKKKTPKSLTKATAIKKTEPVKPVPSIAVIPTAKPVIGIPSGPGLNSDQQAIRISKGLTALSPEGDLLHKVESSNQNLESIATWYTGDASKAKNIAEFNGIPVDAPLPKGTRIKIPKSISRTEKAMEIIQEPSDKAKDLSKEQDTLPEKKEIHSETDSKAQHSEQSSESHTGKHSQENNDSKHKSEAHGAH